jgi:hypothetical protein
MTTEKKEKTKAVKEPGTLPAHPVDITNLLTLPQEFIKAEKNLETLGFFTPSSNWTRDTNKKVISFTRTAGNKKVKASVIIFPSAEHGLPDTSDLDKYRAFQKILSDELIRNKRVPKHITFTSMDLIEAMGKKRKGGEIYKEIEDWLDRMVLTGIKSMGAVWLAGKKNWATDTFHVFERVVAYGQQLDDGTIADQHHIWLSDWQLENINEFWLLSLDYDLHRQLRKPIAKALLPLLQIGFYASGGTYTKRYDELCQFLGSKHHKKSSYIKRQIEPSFKELQEKGFLAKWDYNENKLYKTYNITWQAGERFYEAQELLKEREKMLTKPAQNMPRSQSKPKQKPDKVQQPEVKAEALLEQEEPAKTKQKQTKEEETPKPLAQELINRGITKAVAIDFAESFSDLHLLEKIKMHDYKKETGELTTNAAGWLREAIVQDYKPSEQQLKKQAKLLEKQARQEEQRTLEEKAREIQEQRLREALVNFPSEEEWVSARVLEHINVREEFRKFDPTRPSFTEEEIEQYRQEYKEKVPKTDSERRNWLIGNDNRYNLKKIISELSQQPKVKEERPYETTTYETYPLNSIEDVLVEVARQQAEFETKQKRSKQEENEDVI